MRRELVRDLLGDAEPADRRRLSLATVASVAAAPFELLGLVLVVPLLALLTSVGPVDGGIAGVLADLTGVRDRARLGLVLAALVVLAFAFRATVSLLMRYWVLGVLQDLSERQSVRLFSGYLHEPYPIHASRNTSEPVRTVFTAVDQTFSGFVAYAMIGVGEVTVVLAVAGLLLAIQPVPTLATVIYFSIAWPLYKRAVQHRISNYGQELLDLQAMSLKLAKEGLDGIKDVIISDSHDAFVSRFATVRARHAGTKRRLQFLQEAPRYLLELLFLAGVGVLLLTVFVRSSSEDALPIIALYVAAGFRLMPSISRLILAWTGIRSTTPALESVVNAIRSQSAPERTIPGARSGGHRLQHQIVIDDVWFSHSPGSEQILRGLSLTVRKGESVALVGPSGAGKTTLVDLLLGLYKPDRGTIEIDGVPLWPDLRSWRSQVGYVGQETFLLDGSYRENVAFAVAADDVDDDLVWSCLHQAHLDDFVRTLPSGIDSPVGERGMRLSGGQRQRIGIARALYRQPSVLILDEATSSLDATTEHRIGVALRRLRESTTVIAIAHRLSTIRDFDRIAYLNDGVVQAAGSFTDLVQSNSGFAEMVAHSLLERDAE